jgi:hypothetical protein
VRVEGSALHHVDGPFHDLGLVDAEGERNAVVERPEAQHGREDQDRRQADLRRMQIAGFAPFALGHSDT